MDLEIYLLEARTTHNGKTSRQTDSLLGIDRDHLMDGWMDREREM